MTSNTTNNTDGNEHADPDRWIDFETEKDACGSLSEDGNVVWGAYCPQHDCNKLNTFQGDPAHFANRPYRCVRCNWVSLMDDSVVEIKDSLYDGSG